MIRNVPKRERHRSEKCRNDPITSSVAPPHRRRTAAVVRHHHPLFLIIAPSSVILHARLRRRTISVPQSFCRLHQRHRNRSSAVDEKSRRRAIIEGDLEMLILPRRNTP
jgi:hypothetical protein